MSTFRLGISEIPPDKYLKNNPEHIGLHDIVYFILPKENDLDGRFLYAKCTVVCLGGQMTRIRSERYMFDKWVPNSELYKLVDR